MISKFFSKSKPIHFVIVTIILFLAFVVTKMLFVNTEAINLVFVLKQLVLFGICFFSVFILDFLVSKNKLTKKNSFQILFFVLFMLLVPQTFLNSKLILANLLIIMALRRLISLRSKKQQKKKLLDATIWISLATLLYFWSAMFFILIFASLTLYKISDIKNWIIPIVGILVVFVITYAVLIFLNIPLLDYFSNLNVGWSFDFTNLNDTYFVIGATLLLSYFLWAAFFYLNNLKNKSKSSRPSFLLVFVTALLALVIIIISPNKTGSEFIFLLAPLAIITTNYLEIVSEKWFREVLIWVMIVAPVINLML